MRTDDLIAMLSTNVESVDRRNIVRSVSTAVTIGGTVAITIALVALGPRANLTDIDVLVPLVMKIVFTVVVLGLAYLYLIRLARPGGERRAPFALLAVPFAAIILLAAITLAFAPHSHLNSMIVGYQWLECLLSIPIIAVAPFTLIIWAMRQAMPTDLRRAGALAGLAAGALSATGYALHCIDDSVPFVALWYGLTIALCMLAGAALGPRLLRW